MPKYFCKKIPSGVKILSFLYAKLTPPVKKINAICSFNVSCELPFDGDLDKDVNDMSKPMVFPAVFQARCKFLKVVAVNCDQVIEFLQSARCSRAEICKSLEI